MKKIVLITSLSVIVLYSCDFFQPEKAEVPVTLLEEKKDKYLCEVKVTSGTDINSFVGNWEIKFMGETLRLLANRLDGAENDVASFDLSSKYDSATSDACEVSINKLTSVEDPLKVKILMVKYVFNQGLYWLSETHDLGTIEITDESYSVTK